MEYSLADTRKLHCTGYGNFLLMNISRPKVAPVPVTKVKTPFMKACDWQAANSSSPWD